MFTGEWLEWGQWSECSKKCGGGEKVRSRKCHYDTSHGIEGQSAPCKGAQSDSTECNQHPCTGVGPGQAIVLSSCYLTSLEIDAGLVICNSLVHSV